ncbi:MAG TPA: hypothetical protein VIW64_07070 [Pyrinomonadaceae bacterium]
MVDQNGNRTTVLIGVDYYRQLLAALEEVESTHAYDKAKASADESIPFAEATDEIERERQ